MTTRRAFLSLGLGFGVAFLVACSGGSSTIGNASSSGASGGSSPEPTPESEVVLSPPSSALEVTATIIASTLGDDCGDGNESGSAGDCASDPNGGCGFTCRESNVQLSFKTGTGKNAKVEITSVTLHDAKTGAKLDTLQASNPQSWNGNAYAAWDQMLSPSATVKASYTLSSPSWSTIEQAGGTSSYSAAYRLRVGLKIDGVAVILESAALNREPAVAT